MSLLASAISILLVGAVSVGADHSSVNQEVRALLDAGEFEAAHALTSEWLREHLGEPFPDLRLHSRKEHDLRLHDILNSRTVVFLAGTDYTGSVAMAKELRKSGWQIPGYDRVITLVITLDVPNLRKQVPSETDAYLSEWPLPSYLALSRSYPALFFLSADGTFEGFQRGLAGDRVMLKSVPGPSK